MKTGLNAKTVATGKKAGRLGAAVVVGGVAAVVAGAAWAGVTIVTGYEIGYVAWGVGIVAGFAVAIMTEERSLRTGLIACGLAVIGLLVGKAMLAQWWFAADVVEAVPFVERFKVGLSGFDILWCVLAMLSAVGLATRDADDD